MGMESGILHTRWMWAVNEGTLELLGEGRASTEGLWGMKQNTSSAWHQAR